MEIALYIVTGVLIGAGNMYLYMSSRWNKTIDEIRHHADELTAIHKDTHNMSEFYRKQFLSLLRKVPDDMKVETFDEYYAEAPPELRELIHKVVDQYVDKSKLN